MQILGGTLLGNHLVLLTKIQINFIQKSHSWVQRDTSVTLLSARAFVSLCNPLVNLTMPQSDPVW